MNPVPPFALVAGKWLAVALLGWAIAWIACLGFIPAQWLIQNDSLQAMFQFGWSEVLAFSLLRLLDGARTKARRVQERYPSGQRRKQKRRAYVQRLHAL